MLTSSLRLQRLFAITNFVIAGILIAAGVALPARFWGVDVPLAACVLTLIVCSVLALVRKDLAERVLRISACALLGLGLLVLAIAVLAVSFLLGIHGEFGAMGSLVMGLIAAFIIPYAVLYPLFWLFVFRRAEQS